MSSKLPYRPPKKPTQFQYEYWQSWGGCWAGLFYIAVGALLLFWPAFAWHGHPLPAPSPTRGRAPRTATDSNTTPTPAQTENQHAAAPAARNNPEHAKKGTPGQRTPLQASTRPARKPDANQPPPSPAPRTPPTPEA